MVVAIYDDRRAIWEGLLATLDATIELEREGLGSGQDLKGVAGDHDSY
jgi:hypothetical protein